MAELIPSDDSGLVYDESVLVKRGNTWVIPSSAIRGRCWEFAYCKENGDGLFEWLMTSLGKNLYYPDITALCFQPKCGTNRYLELPGLLCKSRGKWWKRKDTLSDIVVRVECKKVFVPDVVQSTMETPVLLLSILKFLPRKDLSCVIIRLQNMERCI